MFKSKKNKVYMKDSIVIKEHSLLERYEREKYFYKTFAKNDILFFDDEHMTLHLPYFEGDTLLDVLEVAEKKEDYTSIEEAILNVLDVLDDFHENYGYSMRFYDVNFRNFIIGEKVRVIDFEDAKEGDYKDDFFDFCGMLLMYEPSFSVFKKTLLSWIKPEICRRLRLDEVIFDRAVDDALNRIRNRRLRYG